MSETILVRDIMSSLSTSLCGKITTLTKANGSESLSGTIHKAEFDTQNPPNLLLHIHKCKVKHQNSSNLSYSPDRIISVDSTLVLTISYENGKEMRAYGDIMNGQSRLNISLIKHQT